MFSKIRWRLIIYYLAVISVVVLLMGTFFIWYLNGHYREMLRNSLFAQARLAAVLLGEAAAGVSPEELDMRCKKLGSDLGLRLTLVAGDGTVLGDSAEDPTFMENHLGRPEIQGALQAGQGASTRYSSTLGQEMLYVAVPLDSDLHGEEIAGVIRLALSLSQVNAAVFSLRLFVAAALLVSALAALALGMALSSKITEPIKAINRAARSIAGGDFQPPLEVEGRDEMAALAGTIREMGRALQKKVQQILLEKNKLDAVISSANSGIVLVDRNIKIEMLNPAAEQIFNISRRKVTGESIQAALRYHSLFENLNAVYRDGSPRSFELQIYHPRVLTLQASLVPVIGARGDVMGVLALFHDITALRSVERMRTEFVANVSHELRTPLTAIKGYAETILDQEMSREQLSEFLQVIDREAGRLTRLVDSLLDLSQIEGQKGVINKEFVDLAGLIGNACLHVEEMRLQKKMALDLDLPRLPLLVYANPDWLRQAMVNILENSINYGFQGGKITVAVSCDQNTVTVNLADNGPGIPAEDLPYVFERFYRVEKARARKSGGTGLGLAIVKHIMEAHEADYTLESVEGGGTVFRFTLPLSRPVQSS